MAGVVQWQNVRLQVESISGFSFEALYGEGNTSK
jgi:hypothetical protein